jgi:hypothetical protein
MDTEVVRIIVEVAFIVAAIVGSHMRLRVQIAEMKVKLDALHTDHEKLDERLHGVSRNLAELTGHVKGKS